jgi:hypothetical protein
MLEGQRLSDSDISIGSMVMFGEKAYTIVSVIMNKNNEVEGVMLANKATGEEQFLEEPALRQLLKIAQNQLPPRPPLAFWIFALAVGLVGTVFTPLLLLGPAMLVMLATADAYAIVKSGRERRRLIGPILVLLIIASLFL